MRKYFKLTLILAFIAGIFYLARILPGSCPLAGPNKSATVGQQEGSPDILRALEFLRTRNDREAMAIFEKMLKTQPLNLDALWGKAEVLRRRRAFVESEDLLRIVLRENPRHIPSILSLAYIRYKDDRIKEALNLVHGALKIKGIIKKDEALANMLLGSINSRLSKKSWLFGKIRYGTQIKNYFLKAGVLAPELPEVHLGLGTFYLLAPGIIGGNLDEAFKELNIALKIAPDFATANARLAQAYKRKGDMDKYKYYLKKAKELDPENEAGKELEDEE